MQGSDVRGREARERVKVCCGTGIWRTVKSTPLREIERSTVPVDSLRGTSHVSTLTTVAPMFVGTSVALEGGWSPNLHMTRSVKAVV
jgi:hypothetical protein